MRPTIVEMPLYRGGSGGDHGRQTFPPGKAGDARLLKLTEGERRRKQAMVDAHVSQRETLAGFGAADEPYRLAGHVDFTELPNGGDVLYDRQSWGATGSRFTQLAHDALLALGLGVPA